ncbi:MAG: N-acetylmuramoyl-L-alanine amidase [Rhizobacter sp.]|nr:N-acetylmuramoyl-L-alanine amidase [Rhizobacter sp.]
MPRCPFAQWRPISGSSGAHTGGPFKIVHHTTEGGSAEGALDAFAKNRSDPHFTVDGTRIFQHVDTSEGARALRNEAGGVQTNRDSAVQIELVGFAHLPKQPQALVNLARLCRWIEATHDVPRVWPSGPPRPAKNGKDPGGHNRDPQTWDTQGGHYGHCHVPENSHWDPAYSAAEAAFILEATFDAQGQLTSAPPPPALAGARRGAGKPAAPQSTMPDHNAMPTAMAAYIRDLPLPTARGMPEPVVARKRTVRKTAAKSLPKVGKAAATQPALGEAKVDVGSVLCFVDGLAEQEKNDVLYSIQLAQRGASGVFDRFTQTQSWYQKYVEILENLGWASEQLAFSRYEQSDGDFRMDQAALAVITAIATQNQLAVLQQSVAALSKLSDDDATIRLFDFHASVEDSGNFQLGAVQRTANGAITLALGAFYFRSDDERKRFLFFKWGVQQVHFWTAAQRMTLNTDFYARRRDDVVRKLEADAAKFIADLSL